MLRVRNMRRGKIQNMQFYYRLPWMIKWKKILSLYCKKVYCKYCVNNCIAQCNKRAYNLWCVPLFVRLLGEIHRHGVNMSRGRINDKLWIYYSTFYWHGQYIDVKFTHTIIQLIEGHIVIHVWWSLFGISGGPSFFSGLVPLTFYGFFRTRLISVVRNQDPCVHRLATFNKCATLVAPRWSALRCFRLVDDYRPSTLRIFLFLFSLVEVTLSVFFPVTVLIAGQSIEVFG